MHRWPLPRSTPRRSLRRGPTLPCRAGCFSFGECTEDANCDDGDACTEDRCHQGQCRNELALENCASPLCESQTAIPAAQCQALVSIYESTSGPQWTNRSGWLDNPDSLHLVRRRMRRWVWSSD